MIHNITESSEIGTVRTTLTRTEVQYYDTFGFIEIDHKMAKKKFSEKNKNLTLLEIGEELKI